MNKNITRLVLVTLFSVLQITLLSAEEINPQIPFQQNTAQESPKNIGQVDNSVIDIPAKSTGPESSNNLVIPPSSLSAPTTTETEVKFTANSVADYKAVSSPEPGSSFAPINTAYSNMITVPESSAISTDSSNQDYFYQFFPSVLPISDPYGIDLIAYLFPSWQEPSINFGFPTVNPLMGSGSFDDRSLLDRFPALQISE